MGKLCVKCGYERKGNELAPETECPKCGIIYARVEQQARAAKVSPEFRRSPRGRARIARNTQRRLFQAEIPLSRTTGHSGLFTGTYTTIDETTDATRVLEEIEAEGWTLIDAGYVFRPTGSASREKVIGTTEREAISGQIIGIYLFRATSSPPPFPESDPNADDEGRTFFTALPE